MAMKTNVLNVFILIVASYIVFSLNIGEVQVFMLDEAKNAGCAREMMDSQDLVVPTFNYELRTDKPPLHYFFMILSYNLFGFNEFSARFFSVIFGVLTMLITYLFAKRLFSDKIAIWSVLILLSSLHFAFEFHLAVPDPYLIFFINAALFSIYMFFQTRNNLYLWGLYLAMGLGFLTKGPVALVLPALVVFIYMLLTKQFNWENIKQLKILRGILLFILIAAPWYILVSFKTDMAWTEGFFLKHNINRYSDTMEGHGGIYFLTVGFLMFGLLPFSVLLIQGMIYAFKQRINREYYFLFLYIIVFTIFFSFSGTQLPNYIMPVYPACAILVAAFINHTWKETIYRYKLGLSLWIGLIISLLLPIVVYFGVEYDENLQEMNSLAYYLIPLPLGFVAALIEYYKKQPFIGFKFLAAAFISVNVLFYVFMLPKVSEQSMVKDVIADKQADTKLVSYKAINPAFVFYHQNQIPSIDNLTKLSRVLKQNDNVLLISKGKHKEKLLEKFPQLEIKNQQKDLFEGRYSIIFLKEND